MQQPHTIRTARLFIRCWLESDAEPLSRAILHDLEYLRPWMPWAGDAEQQTPQAKLKFIRRNRREFARGSTLGFVILDAAGQHILGSVGMHARIGEGAREIGYWIARDHAGQGLATEAAGALAKIGFNHMRLRRMEIHCDPRNEPSAGVARHLGFQLQTIMRNCVPRAGVSPRDNMVWAMPSADFDRSPANALNMEAFSESGDRLL
jgi:RimJ/RimL family protein N-acetyltransferase